MAVVPITLGEVTMTTICRICGQSVPFKNDRDVITDEIIFGGAIKPQQNEESYHLLPTGVCPGYPRTLSHIREGRGRFENAAQNFELYTGQQLPSA